MNTVRPYICRLWMIRMPGDRGLTECHYWPNKVNPPSFFTLLMLSKEIASNFIRYQQQDEGVHAIFHTISSPAELLPRSHHKRIAGGLDCDLRYQVLQELHHESPSRLFGRSVECGMWWAAGWYDLCDVATGRNCISQGAIGLRYCV